MRITVGTDTDLDVAAGTLLRDIGAAALTLGVDLGERPWCGDIHLDASHAAGLWPLVTGAHLTSGPGLPCAPSRGLTLLAIAGPDTGARAILRDAPITIGRGTGATLRVRDPSVSSAHLEVTPGRRLSARDRGSTNGTTRWRGRGSRWLGRSVVVAAGDVLDIGSSLIAIVDARPGRATPTTGGEPLTAGQRRLNVGPVVASAGSGIAIAVVTGRWYMALIGAVVPAIMAGPALTEKWRTRRLAPDVEVLPRPGGLPRPWPDPAPAHIALVGSPQLTLAAARALAIATGRRLRWTRGDDHWMRWLPAPEAHDPEIHMVGEGEVPSWCDMTIEVEACGFTVRRGGVVTATPTAFSPIDVAEAYARSLAGDAGTGSLPRSVRWADLGHPAPGLPVDAEARFGGAERCAVAIGATATGTCVLDLDVHGPHVLVAGTTGSGKSALLETLVLGLAHAHPPSELSIALIDFKGGAGVRACVGLPHVSGVLTDLNPHLARRALAALARELVDRKAALAAAGLSDFAAWRARGDAPPRLLVVVDEYQELIAHDRDAIGDLARLAAQGRALGLHLVLSTQRPSGAVTPDIRANVGSTIALRVASEAESRDLVGTADACHVPRDCPGRAIFATGSIRNTVQIALPSHVPTPRVVPWGRADDGADAAIAMAAAASARWEYAPRAAALWLDPLPHNLTDTVPLAPQGRSGRAAIWLGRADLPSERRQPDVTWEPESGPLVVAGPPTSGRTETLRLIGAQAHRCGLRAVWLPPDPREAARTVYLARGRSDILLLIDDAHRAIASLADIDRGGGVDSLMASLADGAAIAMALPLTGHHRVAALATTRIILTGGDVNDDAAWTVPRVLHGLEAWPGHARIGSPAGWCEAQLGRAPAHPFPPADPLVVPLPTSLTRDALASSSAGLLGDELPGRILVGVGGDDAGPLWIAAGPVVVVGTPGSSRDAVVDALAAASRKRGAAHAVQVVDSSLAATPSVARDVASATIVVTDPHPRVARDVFKGDLDGLIDPRPQRGRVLVIAADAAVTAQIALDPLGSPSTS